MQTYYLRNRDYDPATGRFSREDPIRSGLNWYAYCGGNPVGYIDPLGLFNISAALDLAKKAAAALAAKKAPQKAAAPKSAPTSGKSSNTPAQNKSPIYPERDLKQGISGKRDEAMYYGESIDLIFDIPQFADKFSNAFVNSWEYEVSWGYGAGVSANVGPLRGSFMAAAKTTTNGGPVFKTGFTAEVSLEIVKDQFGTKYKVSQGDFHNYEYSETLRGYYPGVYLPYSEVVMETAFGPFTGSYDGKERDLKFGVGAEYYKGIGGGFQVDFNLTTFDRLMRGG